MRLLLIAAAIFGLSCPALAQTMRPAESTDSSSGFFAIPQLSVNLYPPALTTINANDTTNLDLVQLSLVPSRLQKVLVFFGDSRTLMFAMGHRFPVTVYSFARAASTSSGVVNRLGNLKNMLVANYGTQIGGIFIQVGVNDMLATNYEFYPTDFKANYRTIAAYLKTNFPNVPVAIGDVITLNSVKEKQRDYDSIDEYNAFLRSLCTENGWTFLEFNPTFANSDRSLKSEYDVDGIHFKPAGHQVMYDKVMTHFMPLMQ